MLTQWNMLLQNLNGLFTMANLNLFLSPYEILLIAQENKYFRKFSYFIMKFVCSVYSLEMPHRGNSNECTQHTFFASLPSTIQEGQLSVSGKRMCTILVNRLED